MNRPAILLLLAALAVPASAPAGPLLSDDPVARAEADVAGFCGQATYEDVWTRRRDLNGDGLEDLLIRYHVACYDKPAPFCGSAGCLTELWYGRPSGDWQLALRTYALAIEETTYRGVPALRVAMAGLACGKTGGAICLSINTFSEGEFLTLWANHDTY